MFEIGDTRQQRRLSDMQQMGLRGARSSAGSQPSRPLLFLLLRLLPPLLRLLLPLLLPPPPLASGLLDLWELNSHPLG